MSGDLVLPGETSTSRDWKDMSSSKGRTVTSMMAEKEDEEEEVVMGLATLPAWVRAMQELARLDQEGKARQYNTAWIRQRIGEQEALSLGAFKIPVLLCLVKSLELECSNPPCKLVDQQGQVSGILHKDVLENYGDVVQVNSVLLLRKVAVIVTARKQYVNISCDNLVAVYKDSEVTQVADLSRRDLGQALPMRKGRIENNLASSAPFSNLSSPRCDTFSPDARISSTHEGGGASVSDGPLVGATNCHKPTSSGVHSTMGSYVNSGNSSVRMPPPSQMTPRQTQTLSRPGQNSVRVGQATVRQQGQTTVRSNLTTTPMINSNMTTTPMMSSNRTPSSTQLPLSFPTPPVINFGQRNGPVGASHPQRLNTPAPSQVFNVMKGYEFSQCKFSQTLFT